MTVTELIADQARTFAVMAGLRRSCRVLQADQEPGKGEDRKEERESCRGGFVLDSRRRGGLRFFILLRVRKISFHGAAGFFTGLLLWKKMCCVIINAWVNAGEAENSKITARSSTWRRPGRKTEKASGGKTEGRGKKGKRRKTAHQGKDGYQKEQDSTATDGRHHRRAYSRGCRIFRF